MSKINEIPHHDQRLKNLELAIIYICGYKLHSVKSHYRHIKQIKINITTTFILGRIRNICNRSRSKQSKIESLNPTWQEVSLLIEDVEANLIWLVFVVIKRTVSEVRFWKLKPSSWVIGFKIEVSLRGLPMHIHETDIKHKEASTSVR